VWKSVKGNPEVSYYIEARTGAEFIRLYALDPNDPTMSEWYESTLYADEGAMVAPCTARAIIYTSAVVGALVTRAVGKFIQKVEPNEEASEVILDLTGMNLVVTFKSSISDRRSLPR
jgi:hypothetical protein